MVKGITKRVGRIISGTVNSLVDAMENVAPEVVMEQSLREIDDAVTEVRAELGKVIAAKHLATKRLAEKNSQHVELTDKIAVALEENRDDLAEAAIARQLDIEAQIPVLEEAITGGAEEERELEGEISALQAKKREMLDELKAYRAEKARLALDKSGNPIAKSGKKDVTRQVELATAAFDRILEKKTGLGTLAYGNPKDAAKLAELEKLSRENRIHERLIAFKSDNANGMHPVQIG